MLKVFELIASLLKHATARDWPAVATDALELFKLAYVQAHPEQQPALAAKARGLGVTEPLEPDELLMPEPGD